MPFAHSPVDGMKTVQFDASVHGRLCTLGAILKRQGASARRCKGLVVAGEVVTEIVGLGQSLRIGSAISRYVENAFRRWTPPMSGVVHQRLAPGRNPR